MRKMAKKTKSKARRSQCHLSSASLHHPNSISNLPLMKNLTLPISRSSVKGHSSALLFQPDETHGLLFLFLFLLVPKPETTVTSKLPGKKANPSKALGKAAPLVVSSPSLLRVTLTKATAKRETLVVKEISLSGIVLVLKDGLWVVKDEEQAKSVPFVGDAPGTLDNAKIEDVDLPGSYLARYLAAEKLWVVCQKSPEQISLSQRMEAEEFSSDIQQLLDGAKNEVASSHLDPDTGNIDF